MDAKKVYQQLDKFITPDLTDSRKLLTKNPSIQEYITDNFKQRFMGLVTDNTENITKVFTAVFLNNKIVNAIIEKDVYDALIFTHHPMHRDITGSSIFTSLPAKLFEELKRRRISSYNLHVPLDKNGPYSTSHTLTEQLGVEEIGEFGEYFGAKVGTIARTKDKDIQSLAKKLEVITGHEAKIYAYGDNEIHNQTIGIIAGGGLDLPFLKELKNLGINTLLTGITAYNDYSKDRHDFAKENNINLIGGTHYSTERFACQKMVEYFKDMGVECEFIEDIPGKEDM